MARENPTWGRRRIQAELALLGYDVAELTVAKYMCRTSPRPSSTWRAFLAAHARQIVAVDFFLVSTLTFRLLFVFIVLRHDRRELLHLHVTDHPTAVWTVRQILSDPEAHHDWAIVATVDLNASDAAGEPVIRTQSFRSAG